MAFDITITKQNISDVSLVAAIIILFIFAYPVIIEPASTDYEFEIILKFSEMYKKPIFLIFHWITVEELQVGELSSVWVEIQDMPYSKENMPTEQISLQFDENQLNFWNTNIENKNNDVPYLDTLIFEPDWENNVFRSNEIEIRFIVPTDISAEFCDNNIQECNKLTNIIHPAPFDLNTQLESNRINFSLSFVVVGLSFVIVWATLRPRQ